MLKHCNFSRRVRVSCCVLSGQIVRYLILEVRSVVYRSDNVSDISNNVSIVVANIAT